MNMHDVFNKFPIFELEDITLRELNIKDAEEFYKYINHPFVSKYLASDDSPASLDEAREELLYWSRLFYYKHSFYWGIAEKKTDKLIGSCGFNNWNKTHNRVEISYDLSFEHWGKGHMTKSIQKICEFARNTLGVNRIQATVAYNNESSIRVLERTGFKKEGMLNAYGILNDVSTDFYMYGSIQGEK